MPEQRIEVVRALIVSRLNFWIITINHMKLQLEVVLARAIQHEIDHLNGKLLVDYLSNIKRDVALRKLKKLKKNCL